MSVQFHFKVSIQEKGKDRQVHVEKSSFTIGRGKDNDVVINDDLISREQVRITHSLGNIWMEELGSSNGTWLDGKRIPALQKMIYQAGQILSFGGRSGPMLALECRVIEDILPVARPAVVEQWLPEKKVVNGPAPLREKLTLVHQKSELPPEDKIIRIKTQAEENLFENIRKLVGSEAEAIRKACLEEAKQVKKNAEDFASQHLQSARVEAKQTIMDAETHISQKMQEWRNFEIEAKRKNHEAKNELNKAQQALTETKDSETKYRQTLEELQHKIHAEESRIQFEMNRLNSEREQFDIETRDLNERIHQAASDEKRLKTELQAEMDLIHFKINQVKVEIEKSESIKETLLPEVDALGRDKNLLETNIADLRLEHEKENKLLKLLSQEYDEAQKGLERSRIEFDVTSKNLEIQRKEIHKSRDEVEALSTKATQVLNEALLESKSMLDIAHIEVQQLNEQRDRLQVDLEIERTQKLTDLQAEMERAKEENEKSLKKLYEKKADLIKDIEKMAVSGHEEFHKVINQAKTEAQELKKDSINEAATLKLVTETEAKRIQENAEKLLEKAEAESKSRLEQLRHELQKEKESLKQELTQLEMRKHSMEEDVIEARRKREDLLDGARDKVREILAQAENDALVLKKQLLDTAKMDAKELLVQTDILAKDEKAKLVIQLAEMKHIEMAKIKEMRAQSEEEWSHRRIERSRTVSTNLYALVASEMYKSRNKSMDDAFIESFSKEFKELVMDTMLDRVGPDTSKLQSILKSGTDAKTKELRFWRKVKISGLSTAVVLAIIILFPQVITAPKNIIVAAFTEKKENSGSDIFFKKLQQSRIKAVYTPQTTPEFKSSYVENILYTTDFEVRVQDIAYQDKWILDLNDWFIRSLDVKDTTLIKFISLESNLLRDLIKMKADIDPANITAGLELMNNRESDYRQKLSEIFADPAKVERYYDFSAKFWNDFYNPRKPAAN